MTRNASLNVTTEVPWFPTKGVTSPQILKPDYYNEPSTLEIFRYFLFATVALFGICGNVLVCFIILRKKRMKSVLNLYLLNLAIADLGILTVCFPLIIVKAADPFGWPLGSFVCRAFYPLSDIFYGISIGSISAIALDRYRAIVYGMKVKWQMTLRIALYIIAFIWSLSFLTIVLPLYFTMKYWEDGEIRDCTPHWPSYTSLRLYFLSLVFLWFAFPLLVIFLTFLRIRRYLNKSTALHRRMSRQRQRGSSSDEYKTTNNADSAKRIEQNMKALRILMPVVIAFSITMLPLNVYRVCAVFLPTYQFKYIWQLFHICTLFLLVSSSVNPVIYNIVSNDFRRGFKSVIFRNSEPSVTERESVFSRSASRKGSKKSKKSTQKNGVLLLDKPPAEKTLYAEKTFTAGKY